MKIAILGYGRVGSALGKKWLKAGHEVKFGVRDPNKVEVKALLDSLNRQAPAVRLNETMDWGEAVFFAVPAPSMEDLLAGYSGNLNGKIAIDATNQFDAPVINAIRHITAQSPQAVVFRAFNSLGAEVFESPDFNEIQADHFYCGPEGPQQVQVGQLIREVGLNPIYVGGLDRVQLVDNLGALWVHLVFQKKMPRHTAFKLLFP
jgi:8-hydroxy-5-deazaflavin:NADPH oxidoreductase